MHTFNTNAFLRRKLQIENTLNHYLAIYIAERNSRKGQGIQEGNRTNQRTRDSRGKQDQPKCKRQIFISNPT